MRAPQHRVSRKAIWWWTLRAAASWLVPLVGLLVLSATAVAPGWFIWIIVGVAVVGVLYTIAMPQWRYRVHRWEATPEAVYTLAGWLNREWRVAPVSRIQTVDTKRGPLEQLLGLATVTVTTASAAGPLHISGVDHDRAVRLVDELTARTQAAEGDAT